MEKLTIIKLGGSLITDKSRPLVAKRRLISAKAKEIKEALKIYKGKLLIGHGSGSFGHFLASKYQTQEGIKDKKSLFGASLVSDVAISLTRLVVKSFLDKGLAVVSFSPGSFILAKDKKPIKSFVEPIEKALRLGIIPLVYGDVVFDTKQGVNISSTETIIAELVARLAKKYKIERIIYAGITNGVYDANSKTIPKITEENFSQIKNAVGGSSFSDVTGGMIHKVKESLWLAKKYKLEILIINGSKKGSLTKAILGKKVYGTLISPYSLL